MMWWRFLFLFPYSLQNTLGEDLIFRHFGSIRPPKCWQLSIFNGRSEVFPFPSTELRVGYEFNVSATLNMLACDVKEYIKQNEDPAGVSVADIQVEQPMLHNILTQECQVKSVMTFWISTRIPEISMISSAVNGWSNKEKEPVWPNPQESMIPEKGKQQVGEQGSKKTC